MANTSTVLFACNETRTIASLSIIAAVVNLGFSIWLVQHIGSIGVILGTIVSYILILVGPQTSKFLEVIRSKASGPSAAMD